MQLSKPQSLIYNSEHFVGGAVSVLCGSFIFDEWIPLAELSDALNQLLQINPVLRTKIHETNGIPEQVVEPYHPSNFDILTFEKEKEFDEYARQYAHEPLDFYGNLCEFKIVSIEEKNGILVKLHHIIGDAWSMVLLADQLTEVLDHKTPKVGSYVDYLKAEEHYMNSRRFARDRQFFLDCFQKCDEPTYISDRVYSTHHAARSEYILDQEKTEKIRNYCSAKEISPFVLFTSVFSSYFSRIRQNCESFFIGISVLNRSTDQELRTVGMFVNTSPVLIEVSNEKSFEENMLSIKGSLLSAMRHQKFNYGDVLEAIRQEAGFKEQLYDVVISYQNAALNGGRGQVETKWYPADAQVESLQIHIDDRNREGIFRISYDYQTDKFTAAEIDQMHGHLMNILSHGLANGQTKLRDLTLLSEDEVETLLNDFNDTAVDYSKEQCVYELFLEHVRKTPNKTALVFEDVSLSYHELNQLIQSYISKLMRCGIKEKDVVAIHLERSVRLIALQLATLAMGAVFLPVDKRLPIDRIRYMCDDCDAKLLISDSLLASDIQVQTMSLAEFEALDDSIKASTAKNTGVCYIIYTSGSTGRPKGCMLTGRGLLNFCLNNNTLETLRERSDNIFACVNSVSFDYFIAESLLPLTNGYATVIFNDEESSIQDKFLETLARNDINVLMTTPTRLKIYFDDRNPVDSLQQLTCICTSGEPLSRELLGQMYKRAPHAQIYNPIGPSECSVWDIGGKLDRAHGLDVHIGKPIANAQIYIVDQFMNLLPIGVTGEICIAGDGVGAGYINRPQLTKERFLSNPFGEGRLYRTGDLAYWRRDGNITYIGRNDFQVKIRGLRIELSEIENAISSIDGIREAVVVARKNDEGRQLLCAFYTGEKIEAKEIRESIGKTLAPYMIPHIFTHLDRMPMTTTGKISRKALPEVNLSNVEVSTVYAPPENESEAKLCALFSEVLNISRVGIDDNFFDIGGDSLKAIELTAKARAEGFDIALQKIFDFPTARRLSRSLNLQQTEHISYGDDLGDKYRDIMNSNVIDDSFTPEKNTIGNVLLTGATGFLGAHILRALLQDDVLKVYCLVRDEQRLYPILNYYFGSAFTEALGDRVVPVKGDLLNEQLSETLPKDVDTVIHAAASVKHYGTYEDFKKINTEATRRIAEYAQVVNGKLIHLSTFSVSGNSLADQLDDDPLTEVKKFDETTLYFGQPLDNVYIRSKFEAEVAVLEKMRQGLAAKIIRVGNLTNRYEDLKFQPNYEENAFLQRLRAFMDLGLYPDYLMNLGVEFSPVDKTAEAIQRIIRYARRDQTVFHLNNDKVLCFKELMMLLDQLGTPMRMVGGDEFSVVLKKTMTSTQTAHIFEHLQNELSEGGNLIYESNIHIENAFSRWFLKKTGFEWPAIDFNYIQSYLNYFRKAGFIR